MTDAIARRFVSLLLISSIACMGPVQGAVNPVPVLAIKLDQAMATVYTNSSAPSIVVINGSCTVDKLPIERATVTLTSSTDVGWVSQISPTTMVFTSTAPQSFTCTVVVPQGTPNMTATLVVDGRAVAGGLQSTTETKALITNIGPPPYVPPANQTGNGTAAQEGLANRTANITDQNGTARAGATGGGMLGMPNDLWIATAAVVVVAGIAGYAISAARTRRNSRADNDRPEK
jgi:hypothetical protein